MAATTIATELRRKIDERTATVGVIGLGYVGLPLALAFSEGGFRTVGFDVDATKVEALRRGRTYIQHLDGDRLRRTLAGGRLTATGDFATAQRTRRADHLRAHPADPAARPGHELRRRHGAADPVEPAARGNWSCSSRRPTRAPPTSSSAASWRSRACGAARISSWRSRRSARIPATLLLHDDHPEGRRAASDATGRRSRRKRSTTRSSGSTVRVRRRADRRGHQAHGEHLPRGQHRARQRAQDGLRPHGHRHLGGARRGGDEAVRLHAVQPGSRLGRALHPAGSLLPLLEGARVRHRAALHRARRRGQRPHAALRDREAAAGAERSPATPSRAAGSWSSASRTRRTSTIRGRARPSRSSTSC